MRLIDLRCDWALQYAAESSQYDPAAYPEIPPRVARLNGYLMGASLAILRCRRTAADWAAQPSPWQALDEMLARCEAEFSGRLLATRDDVGRWEAEPADALCWAAPAVVGLDSLLQSPADLDRLAPLFQRGVRVFQTSRPDPDFLGRLAELATEDGPRPILDLADADASAASTALAWFEADPERPRRVLLLHSACDAPTLESDLVGRLRALGGTVGVIPGASPEAFRSTIDAIAALAFLGEPGYRGIGVSTDFLGTETVAPELADVDKLIAWIAGNFPADVAPLLIEGNARRLLKSAAGAP